ANVWHFFAEPDNGAATWPVVPAESLLAKWQTATDKKTRRALAMELQKLLTSGPPAAKDSPDAALFRQLASMRGPLLGHFDRLTSKQGTIESNDPDIGLDPNMFGHHPNGRAL